MQALLPHRDAALQQEGADLIDDAGALAHQLLARPMQRLQIELLGGLGRDELVGAVSRLKRSTTIALPIRDAKKSTKAGQAFPG
jgi:hypothetical protein